MVLGGDGTHERGSSHRHMEQVHHVPKKSLGAPGSKGSHQHVADPPLKLDPATDIDSGHLVHPLDTSDPHFKNLLRCEFTDSERSAHLGRMML